MKKDTSTAVSTSSTRQSKAHQLQANELSNLSPKEIQELIHELRTYQTDLELQNNALRQTQQQLKEECDRYADLYNFAPVGYLTLNEKGGILEANLTAATVLGVERSSLIKKLLARFILPEDQDIYYFHYTQLLSTHKQQQCNLRMVKGNSLQVYMRIKATVGRPGGEFTHRSNKDNAVCRIVLNDITKQVRAEEAVRENEKKYRTISELVSSYAYSFQIKDNNTPILEWITGEFTQITGYTPKESELRGGAMALVYPQDRPIALRRMEALFAGKKDVSEFRIVTKSGELRWLQDYGIPEMSKKKDGVVRIVGAAQDITEHKRLEEELKQRNLELAFLNRTGQAFTSVLNLEQVLDAILEEVRQLLGVVACSIWLTDEKTEELVCRQVTNPGSDIVRGWRLSPGVGIAGWVTQHGQSVIVPDVDLDKRHFKEVDKKIGLQVHSILSVPLQVRNKVIGTLQALDETINRFNQTDLRLLEPLATTAAIAIENARLYEQALKNAQDKEVLLHEVNHRVKNNLSSIIGLLYIEKYHAEEEQLNCQTTLEDMIHRIQGLATVHHLLSVIEWTALPLDKLTRQVINSALQILPPDKNVKITLSPSPIQVASKLANGLALIINELTTNSVKYAWPQCKTGHITINIALNDENDMILFEFKDDGTGYPENVLNGEYHNVGLELVQNIVSGGLNGEVTIFNNDGATTFIRFPAEIDS